MTELRLRVAVGALLLVFLAHQALTTQEQAESQVQAQAQAQPQAQAQAQAQAQPQCNDAVARMVIKTLGSKKSVVGIALNFVKCMQRVSAELYKIVNDLLVELAGCLAKNDVVEVVKCMVSDSGMKKLSGLVLKFMDILRCSLD